GIHHYDDLGAIEVVDLAAIQGVVGRIFNRGCWAIIDRGGALAQAEFIGRVDNENDNDIDD
ncbi:hypothetical protein M422DRAFT_193938, partial [Sphaerobolus stellatus SS14]